MKVLLTLSLIFIALTARAAEHEGKDFDLLLSPGGLAIYGALSISEELTAGFHVTDDDVLLVNYQYMPQLLSDDFSGGKASGVGVFYQHYVGESFNMKVGVSQVTYTMNDRYIDSNFNYVYTHSISRVTSLDARIGNQWTWGSFVLGVDWVGLALPIIRTVTQDDGHVAKPGALFLRLVQLNIGASF